MIVLSPECFPCFLRQADLAARAHGASEFVRKALAARVSRVLAEVPGDEIPARIATRLQAVIRDELGTDDPFREVKEREFVRFREMVSKAESFVAASADPTAASVWMAVYGNIMDSGIIDRDSMEVAVSRLAAGDGDRKIPDRLRDAIRDAQTIGVLLDNSGEAAFDVPLLSRLSREGRTVWVGVKGGAVIDDLTEAEARRLGLSTYAEIVSNGNRGVGTDLGLCTREFRERIEGSDLVLSKGQANFETLYGHVRNVFFLFRCKCPVISRALGHSEGDLILLDGEGAG